MTTIDEKIKTVLSVSNTAGGNSKQSKFTSVTGKGTVNAGLKNYANTPVFLKKAAEAKAEIDRVGLPKKNV